MPAGRGPEEIYASRKGRIDRAGIDMDGLLKRLMGNAALVRILMRKFTEDRSFQTAITHMTCWLGQ